MNNYKDLHNFLHKKAKQLKKRPTAAEVVFERKLKELNIPYKTQWPYIAGGLCGICDFCLPELFVIIEIDGGYHLEEEQKQTDDIKDFVCENQLKAKILRLTNNQAFYLSIEQIKILIENTAKKARYLIAPILANEKEKRERCSVSTICENPVIYKIDECLYCKKHGAKKKRKLRSALGLLKERAYGNMW